MSVTDPSAAFSRYMLAQEERRTAYERYNYAGAALELARIRERLAEIGSQSEPLASLLTKPLGERDRLYSAAFYVVVGRMPEVRKEV
jgi:hypothetical protein